MYDFLFLSFSLFNKINLEGFEKYILSKSLVFSKKELGKNIYSNSVGYQFFKSESDIKPITNNCLVAGEIYGLLHDFNPFKLNIEQTNKLFDENNIRDNFLAFEGSACFLKAFEDKIVIQSDIEGYRKLFYYKSEKIFCVSTRLPFIIKLINNDWKINKNGLINFLNNREAKWPLTCIDEIYTFPHVSRIEVAEKKWNIINKSLSEFYDKKKISLDDLRESLYSRYKLITDRKNGKKTAVALSGGIDSNCLVRLYDQNRKNGFTAVSVGYDSINFRSTNINDETIYAKKIAEKLKIPFKRYFFNSTDFFNELDGYISTLDQPAHDPSSNYIMNKYLRYDGYDLIVNGMGGDANFSYKKGLSYAYKLYNFSKYIGLPSIHNMGRFFSYKGPFKYYKSLDNSLIYNSFHEIIEYNQLFSSPLGPFISHQKLLDLYSEIKLRSDFNDNINKNLKNYHELFYSLALYSNPDEYHSLIMAERNNIDILMPFVNIPAVLKIFNACNFNYKVNTREFEMSVFGGIDTDLLVKTKSGFSIPYSEWIPPYSSEVFNFYLDLKFFEKSEFDLEKFRKKYSEEQSFKHSDTANKVVWKLLVFKKFIELHNLNF